MTGIKNHGNSYVDIIGQRHPFSDKIQRGYEDLIQPLYTKQSRQRPNFLKGFKGLMKNWVCQDIFPSIIRDERLMVSEVNLWFSRTKKAPRIGALSIILLLIVIS